jgi:hypothetical protein
MIRPIKRNSSNNALSPAVLPLSSNEAEVSPKGDSLWVVRPVSGLDDGQGLFGERPGPVGPSEVLPEEGEVAQAGGDGGVVRAVGGLVDGQGCPRNSRSDTSKPGRLAQSAERLHGKNLSRAHGWSPRAGSGLGHDV